MDLIQFKIDVNGDTLTKKFTYYSGKVTMRKHSVKQLSLIEITNKHLK